MTAPDTTTPTTKARILDAAEALFADHGFNGTSLRAVTSTADVNLASVHYHFGSKTGLFEAVIRRRVDDLNAERLRLLDAVLAQSGPPTLTDVLHAFLAPAILHVPDSEDGFQRFQRLIGRIVGSPGPEHEKLRRIFQTVLERFLPAFQAAAPHLSPRDLHWRFHFLIGSMCTQLVDPGRIRTTSGGVCSDEDPEEALAHLIAFAAAGFAAPCAEISERESS